MSSNNVLFHVIFMVSHLALPCAFSSCRLFRDGEEPMVLKNIYVYSIETNYYLMVCFMGWKFRWNGCRLLAVSSFLTLQFSWCYLSNFWVFETLLVCWQRTIIPNDAQRQPLGRLSLLLVSSIFTKQGCS